MPTKPVAPDPLNAHELPPQQLADFLIGLDFAAALSVADRLALAEMCETRAVPQGEVILGEGQPSNALYVVWSGAVEVLKHSTSGDFTPTAHFQRSKPLPGDDTVSITRLERGALFGEMSFIDRLPASATVVAAEHCVLLIWRRKQLEQALDGALLEQRLTAGVAVAVIRRMRQLTATHVRALQEELLQSRLRVEFARFFAVTMVLFGIASTVQKLIHPGLPPLWQMLYSWGFLLLSFAPIAWFALRQHLPPSQFGLTWNGWQRNLREATGLSLGLVVLAAVIAAVTREAGQPLASWGSVANYNHMEQQVFFLAYLPHCFIQEFIGRGVIQTSLGRLMPDSKPGAAIVMTSALFGIYHFYVSVSFAVTTFVVSLAFGWLFHRHQSLLGVTIVHVVLGVLSLAIGLN